ncbi:MAG: subtilisin-like proprotein convertase family protein [Planctomycetaceae bacterium]|jgi:subtilisin-like proprotein convertase family protein
MQGHMLISNPIENWLSARNGSSGSRPHSKQKRGRLVWHRSAVSGSRSAAFRGSVESLEERVLLSANTLANAILLDVQTTDQAVSSDSVLTAADIRIFAVPLIAGQAVTVDIDAETLGSTLDALVRVFDPIGNEVASVDNLATRNEQPLDPLQLDPELAFHAVTTGTWFIGVSSSGNDSYDPASGTGVSGNSAGTFSLKVTLDSGATTETATPVSVAEGTSVTLTESIGSVGDRDSYRIDLAAGQVIEATLQTDGLDGDLQGRIELYGPDIRGLGLVDTGSSDEPVFLYQVIQSGPHFFDVLSSTVTSTTGDYEVTFRILDGDQTPVDGVGDTFDTAQLVEVTSGESVTVSAEIEFNNDADLFAVDLSEGQRLSVDLDAFDLDPRSRLDSILIVFDSEGVQRAENDDAQNSDSALTFQAPATGRYFVGISGFSPFSSGPFDPVVDGSARSTSRGRFDLTFSIEAADNPSLRFISPDTPVTVSGGITQIAIDVPLAFAVQDVNVELSQNILASNLKLTLVSPAGTRVSLVNNPTFFGTDYDSVILDDEADSSISTARRTFDAETSSFLPATGSFIPIESLSILDGESSAGMWILEVDVDGFAIRPVTDFSLQLEPASTFASTNVPFAIVNDGTITSQLVITDEIPIADLDVELDITHAFDGDLRVFLISPAGTRVELFTDLGGSGQGFTATVLDDESDISITTERAPFTGRFRPEGTLSDFDGESIAGVWTLEITDTFFLDGGTLNSWSLNVVPGTTGNISGFVFLNVDQLGLLSGPEPGLAGTTVFVDMDNNGLLDEGEQSTVTDSTGAFLIRDVVPGNARVIAETPAGLTPVSSTQTVSVVVGQTTAVNLGFAGQSSIRGTVFFDDDGSGGQSADERGMAVRTVFVDFNANGLPDVGEPAALTNSSGVFELSGLTPGVHQLSIAGNLPLVLPADNRLFVTTTAGMVTESADFAVLSTSVFDSEPNDTSDNATRIAPTTATNGALTTNDVDLYELSILEDGRLQLDAAATTDPLDIQVRLLTEDGTTILVSNGSSRDSSTVSLDVHLSAGTYRVEIVAQNGTTGGYGLRSDFLPAESPDSAVTPALPIRGFERESVIAGDFNGDGIVDMATADGRRARVTVLIGVGDGSFRDAYSMPVDAGPRFLATADLNNDGIPDLVSANGGQDFSTFNRTLSVFLGVGNGTFRPEYRIRVGEAPREVTAVDFNGDGTLDLATANSESDDVSILIGRGDGTFQSEFRVNVGEEPESLTAADLNRDGNIDLAVANRQTNVVSILFGDGVGGFTAGPDAAVGSFLRTQSVRHGDVNRDGFLDLVTANEANFVEVLLGTGNGTFRSPIEVPVGEDAEMVLLEDLTGDGLLDLATANRFSNDVSIRIGSDDGLFGPETRLPVEFDPVMLVSGDFNGDGQNDIAVANRGDVAQLPKGIDGSISFLLNRGGGVFQSVSPDRLLADDVPTTIQIADVNNDGRPEIISANQSSTANGGSISVLAGLGNGDFEAATQLDVKARSIAVADVNRDGRLDLVSVNGRDFGLFDFRANARATIPGVVTVHLGLGDNEFQQAGSFDVGMNAISVTLADFNGDSILDVVTANEFPVGDASENGTLSVLIGNGDGTFGSAVSIEAGVGPSSVIAEDLDQDGNIDLAVTNRGESFGSFGQAGAADNRVFVYWGNGDGTFEAPQIETVGNGPKELIAVDLNLDGLPELVTVNRGARLDFFGTNNTISILSPSVNSPRQYTAATTVTVPQGPTDLVSGDFNGDGNVDLAIAGSTENLVAVLLGGGDLSFSVPATIPLTAALQPESLQTADLNGDGFLDLAVANLNSDDVSVLLGVGDGSFVPADQLANLVDQAGPLTADVNADGLDDVLSIDQNGQILVRAGRSTANGLLAAPFVLNANSSARSITTFRNGEETLVAAVSRDGRSLTLHGFDEEGRPEVRQQTDLPGFVSVFAVADVTGDGIDDVVGALPLDGQVILLRNDGAGRFGTPELINVGEVPAAVDLVDLDGIGGLDVVVTARNSAVAHLLVNDGSGNFATPLVYPTSTAPIVLNPNSQQLGSLTRPVGQTLGDFDGDGLTDFLVVNQGERSFQLLKGTGNGSFADPSVVASPTSVVDESIFGGLLLSRDVTGDGQVDQVIASAPGANVITIMGLDDGASLNVEQELSTGASVAGISLADMNADSLDDLLVNTSTGDLIIFPGLGGGRFGEFFRTQSTVPIAVQDLDGDGRLDVITANSAFDRVNIDFGAHANADVILSDNNAPFAAPGAVELGDINGDGLDDLVVANTGGNEVFLFPRLTAQSFATEPIVLFSGTNPTGLSIDDVNGDGRNDLVVANRGSNDVTIFLGTTTTDTGFDTGRRLAAGVGPVSAEVMIDSTTGAVSSLIVTNADEGTVSMLPAVQGLGGSIFNDQAASTIAIGQTSSQGGQIIGNSFVATNPLDDSFTFISNLENAFLTGAGITSVSSRGDEPSFALPTDFNFDGILDLIVANSGDGSIVLFAGGDIGFVFSDLLSTPSLAHPAAMDIAEINGVLNLFVTEEGEDVASIFEVGRNPGQNSPFPLPFIPLPSPGNDGFGLPDNQFQSALTALTNILLASLNMNGQQPEAAKTRTPVDGPAPVVSRWLQRANDALYSFISPLITDRGINGTLQTRGIEQSNDFIRSFFQTTLVTPFPILGLLVSPFLSSSDGVDGKPEAADADGADNDQNPASQPDASSNAPATTDDSDSEKPDGSASASRSSSQRDSAFRATEHAVLRRVSDRRSGGAAAAAAARFDYQRIDGVFADVASRSSDAERLFDDGLVRERRGKHRAGDASENASRSEQRGDHPSQFFRRLAPQNLKIDTEGVVEFESAHASNATGTVLTTFAFVGHYLNRAQRNHPNGQVTSPRKRRDDSEIG